MNRLGSSPTTNFSNLTAVTFIESPLVELGDDTHLLTIYEGLGEGNMAKRNRATEHNGPKRGKGIGRKAWVKQASRKKRRQQDRMVG